MLNLVRFGASLTITAQQAGCLVKIAHSGPFEA